MKRLDEELGLKDANAEKTTATRAMAMCLTSETLLHSLQQTT